MEGGIYKIKNKVNGKLYIGRTKNFQRRFKQYEYDFRYRRLNHINEYLMNSMEKYGFDCFEFTPIEYCEYENQPERELFWIEHFKSNIRDFGYNLRLDVGGVMITDSRTSEKISNRLRTEWAKGERSQHSEIMKELWKSRSREDQGRVMTRALTKWLYIVDGEEMLFSDLKRAGLSGVLQKFHKKRSDSVTFKSRNIKRVPYDHEP